MGEMTVPPGGGQQDRGKEHLGSDHHQGEVRQEVSDGRGDGKSYSDRLKTNVRYDQRLKRNVLEITLEKTNNDAVIDEVDAEDVARVLKTLGIDYCHTSSGIPGTLQRQVQYSLCLDGSRSQS